MRTTIIAAGVAFAALAASASAALAASSMKTLVRLAPMTIPAGTMEKTIPVNIRGVQTQLLTAAKSRQYDVTLELDVEAERSPQVFYEVYLSAPKGRRYHVGNVTLFGAGIRSEARGEFHPAHVQLFISDAVSLALRKSAAHALEITFVAKGAEGGAAAKPVAALVIHNAEIVAGPRQRS